MLDWDLLLYNPTHANLRAIINPRTRNITPSIASCTPNFKASNNSKRISVKESYVHAKLVIDFTNNSSPQSSLTSSIAKAEAEVDKAERVTSDLRTLQVDIEEKERRLEKIKSEIRTANYDERLTEATKKGRTMEMTRDELNSEFRALSVQADSRAKLDIMRDDVKRKTNEMNNTSVHVCMWRP